MRKQVVDKVAQLVTAAFGLVAALAWNTAIQETFKAAFGEARGLPAMFGYALVVTVVAVVTTVWIGRVAQRREDEGGSEEAVS